jgi:hypothetical protein
LICDTLPTSAADYDAWQNVVDTHHFVANYSAAAAVGLAAGIDQEVQTDASLRAG